MKTLRARRVILALAVTGGLLVGAVLLGGNDSGAAPSTDSLVLYHKLDGLTAVGGSVDFSDDFDDNSLAASWNTDTNLGGAVTESGQQLELYIPADDTTRAAVESSATYDLTGKSVAVEIVSVSNPAQNTDSFIEINTDINGGGDGVRMTVYNGQFFGAYHLGGSWSSAWTGPSYNDAVHKFWRIRESAGDIFFETSTDGTVWTTHETWTNGGTVDISDMYVRFSTQNTNGAVASANTTVIDNFFVGVDPSYYSEDVAGGDYDGLSSGPALAGETATTSFANPDALSFDGGDHIEIEDELELNPGTLTVSAWVKPNDVSGYQTVVSKWNHNVAQQWTLQLNDNNASFTIADGTTSGTSYAIGGTLTADTWYHLTGTYDGSNLKVYVDGVEATSSATTTVIAPSASPVIVGAKQMDSAVSEFFDGYIDDVRVYNRVLSDIEIGELAGGDHTSAIWDGSDSPDYEDADNWDTAAVPDNYTLVTVANVANNARLSADVELAGLTIQSGAALELAGWDLTLNDSGVFSNEGSLVVNNSEVLTGFANDTDSGAVVVASTGAGTGTVVGNTFNDLIINDSTLAHWTLDNSDIDLSGYGRNLTANDGSTYASNVPDTNFANSHSGSFDGTADYFGFDALTVPATATYCAWVNSVDGEGVVLGGASTSALALSGGTTISIDNGVDSVESWTLGSSLGGGWHHICLTAEETVGTSIFLFVDGVQEGTVRNLTSGIAPLSRIGEGYEGNIDDVKVFDRVLSSGEIADLAAGDQPALASTVLTLGSNIDVNGTLVVASGELDTSETDYDINLGGDLLVTDGVLDMQEGELILDGSDQTISSSGTYHDITKTVSAAATLTIGRGTTQTIAGTMNIQGAAGQVLSLVSSTPGTQWNMVSNGTRTIDYLDVTDSVASPLIDTTGLNISTTNSTGWEDNVAPDAPSGLGSSELVDGSTISDSTPTLEFTLADTNAADQVSYQVQIDNDSDFSSPVVDYSSALGAQTSYTFTVGQAAGTGSYVAGAESQTLSSGDYYWRVRAIDNYSSPNTGAWAAANGGAVAFEVDQSGPSTPGTPTITTPTADTTPELIFTASTDANDLGDPAYTIEWSDDDFAGGVDGSETTNSTTFSPSTPLADGTWHFRVRAVDSLGNLSSDSDTTSVVIDSEAPSTPGSPSIAAFTNDTTPTFSWTASTDNLDLADPAYTIEWSDDDFAGGVDGSDTTGNLSFALPELTPGNWYVRVRATDVVGNSSSDTVSQTVMIDVFAPSIPGDPSTTTPTNDTTPEWSWAASTDGSGSGLADPTYLYEWSDDNFATAADGNGSTNDTSFAHSSDLTPGTWSFRVRSADKAGNQSLWSSLGSVIIDTTAPSTPGTPITATPTNDTTPEWSWAASTDGGGATLADPAYTIEWSDDGFATIEGSDTTNSTTYANPLGLAEGSWSIRVKAADKAGSESGWSGSGTVTIDTTAPSTPGTPTITTPTADTTPELIFTASTDANDLGDPAYTIEWSDDDFAGGVDGSETTNSTTFSPSTPLADGTWHFRVRAVDAADNQSADSGSSSVIVDTIDPSDPGTPSTTTPTNDKTPEWNWAASSDSGSDVASYTVEWANVGDFSSVTDSGSSGTTSFTHTDDLSDGTWYFRVRAVDNVGHVSDWSETGSVIVDTTAPSTPGTPNITSPTTDTTPNVSWTASTDANDLADPAYTVQWSQDSDFSGTPDESVTNDNATFTPTTLSDGTWYFRVKVTDEVGNESGWSGTGTVIIDTTIPTAPGSPQITSATNDSTPSVEWSASGDSGSGVDYYEINWSQDSEFGSGVSSDTTENLDIIIGSTLADGTWHFRVRAIDNLALEGAWSGSTSFTIDTTAPDVPDEPQPDPESPTSNNLPTWGWTESDDGTGLGMHATEAYLVEWSQDSGFGSGVQTGTAATNEFPHLTELADGTWYFRLRAQDEAGNISNYSPNGTVIVDTTNPTIPGDPSTTTPTTDSTPSWSWTASTDIGGTGVEEYIVEWSIENDFDPLGGTASPTTNSYTHSAGLTDGRWYFRVRAVDETGNQSGWSELGIVDTDDTAPGIPGTPTTSTPTSDTTPSWSFSTSADNFIGPRTPAYDVEWSQNSDFSGTPEASTTNSGGFLHTVELAEGNWYIRVRAVDALNNTSEWSGTGTVQIATGGPSNPGEPIPDQIESTNTTPSWTWEASDGDAELETPPYHLEWSQDSGFGSGVETDTAATNEFTHTTPLTDGVWYLRIRAEDQTGLFSGYSEVGQVRVDTTAPTDPGEPSGEDPTADDTPQWSWAASTDDGGSGFPATPYTVEWSSDNFSSVAGSDTASGTTYTHATGLADGTWSFRVRATDKVGNTSGFSAVGSLVVDTTNPSPAGLPSTTSPTQVKRPEWTWAAADDADGSGVDYYETRWSTDSGFDTGVQTSTSPDAEFTHSTDLADGLWYFQVRAIDQVGNASTWSSNGEVRVDTTAPLQPGEPSAGAGVTNDLTPTWTWDVSTDSGSGLTGTPYQVRWSDSDNTCSDFDGNDTSSTPNFTHDNDLSPGTWYLCVRAEDNAGNTSNWVSGEVLIDTNGPDAPPAAPDTETPTNDSTPSWTWEEPSVDGSAIDHYELQWKEGGAPTDADPINDTTDVLSFTHATALTDGTWYFRVRAIDGVANVGAWSAPGTVLVDTTAPDVPDTPSSSTPQDDNTPTWTWNDVSDAEVYELQWALGADPTGDTPNDTTSTESYTHSSELSQDGTWHFRVRAVDTVGNKSAWSTAGQKGIDTSNPEITDGPTATSYNNGAVVGWSTSEDATSIVEWGEPGNLFESSSDSDLTSEHEFTLGGSGDPLLSCTTYSYRVMSVDALGNESVWSSSKQFTTTGCSGSAAIMQKSSQTVGATGGEFSLESGSADVSLDVATGAVEQDTSFQIKQLSPASSLQPISKPSGHNLVGSHVYDLKAVASGQLVTSFDENITVGIGFTSAEISSFMKSSLSIWRHDGSSWHKLESCNIGTSTVECDTNNFSVFGLFGIIPQPETDNDNTNDDDIEDQAEEEPELPEGEGVTPSLPVPETAEEKGEISTASEDESSIASVVTQITETIKRPAGWMSLLLVTLSVGLLLFIRKRKDQDIDKNKKFGVHKDD